MPPKVSVIIPVYGVEHLIERCADSLFNQTLDNIEFIFVDDCSPDHSMELLQLKVEEYQTRIEDMSWTIITERMTTNSGQAAVREHGVLMATGDYIIHCDSDDWIDPDMYRAMYAEAIKGDKDMVVCDYYLTDGRRSRHIEGCSSDTISDFMDNCLFQKNSWAVWNKLFKRKCYKGIAFPVGNMGEDMVMSLQLLLKCKKWGYIRFPYYYYYVNPYSITRKSTIENCMRNYNMLKKNTDFLVEYIEKYYPDNVDKQLACLYLQMLTQFALLPIKHVAKYQALWNTNKVIMPIRFFYNRKIRFSVKILYILSFMGIYPLKKDKVV